MNPSAPSVPPHGSDPVLAGFLSAQLPAGMAFAGESDIVQVAPLPPFPPVRYLVHFHCKSLAGTTAQDLREVTRITVGIQFFANHLRAEIDPGTVTVLEPLDLWHPNVRGSFVCVGHLSAGATLTDLLYQLYDVFRWDNYAMHDGLNLKASAWARQQPPGRFPIDRRPLRRPKPHAASEPAPVNP